MEVLYPLCAGLDVHAKTVVACVRSRVGCDGDLRPSQPVSTHTRGSLELTDWLTPVTHVVMEATGVYWKPVWQDRALEGHATLVLANAMHIRTTSPAARATRTMRPWISRPAGAWGSFAPASSHRGRIQELRHSLVQRARSVRENMLNRKITATFAFKPGIRIDEALDHPHVPDRSVAVHPLGDQTGGQLRKLSGTTRCRQLDAVQMVVKAEVGVVPQRGLSRFSALSASFIRNSAQCRQFAWIACHGTSQSCIHSASSKCSSMNTAVGGHRLF